MFSLHWPSGDIPKEEGGVRRKEEKGKEEESNKKHCEGNTLWIC